MKPILSLLRMPTTTVKPEPIDPTLHKPTIGKLDVRAAIMAKLKGGK